MRDLIISILIPAGLLWSLFSPSAAVIVLNWICFQRPYDFSWGLWNQLPVFQFALIATMASTVLRGKFRLRLPAVLVVYLLLFGWITLSATYAYRTDLAWEFWKVFVPPLIVTPIVMFATIHELSLLRAVIAVAAGGIGINAVKTSISLTLHGGGQLTDQIAGFVGDNNVFGLVLCPVVAILLGLQSSLPQRRWLRILYAIGVVFVMLCIVYTKSRGALISLVVILTLRSIFSRKPLRNLVVLAAFVGLATWLVPESYFSRLSTMRDLSADTSAMGRFENWQLSIEEAQRFPFFGVGPNNHVRYNNNLQPGVQVRVAHSVYFQVLGENGYPALVLYLLFVGIGLWSLLATWREMIEVARRRADLDWVRDLASWMTFGYVGYIIGSGFLNMLYIEFPWYVAFFGVMLRRLAHEAALKPAPSEAPSAESAAGAPAPRDFRRPARRTVEPRGQG